MAHEDDIPAEEDLSRKSTWFSFENEHCKRQKSSFR